MTNGEKLLRDDPQWIASCIAEYLKACNYCAYNGSCQEGQKHYDKTCTDGIVEWLGQEVPDEVR